MNIQIDIEKVINNLLEQNKQLTLEVATLKAAIEQINNEFGAQVEPENAPLKPDEIIDNR